MSGLGRYVGVRAVVVVAALAGCLALAHPTADDVEALASKMVRAMAKEGSADWAINMTTTEIIETFGYPTEIHHVTTDDGYILELHRIPRGIAGTREDRPVALLQHGLLCSSSAFIMNNPDEALAYVLADAGYDVWMPNFRGNTYSRAHVDLDPDDIDFWRFSWNEMGVYDLPSIIDYILATTGREDLYYAGWSMGTTTFYVLMSEKPEYNSKVRAMVSLAPVAYMDYAQGLLAELAPISGDMDTIFTLLGVGELAPGSEFLDSMIEKFCDIESVGAEICYNFLFLIAGPDSDELNEEYLPVILSQAPAGTSVHTINHYAQIILSGKFQKYDYGLIGNMEHYGQSTPPLYNLNNVTANVGLFWGQTDWLATPLDVEHLAADLPNVALNYRIDKDQFNHIDFCWCIHTYEYVNRHIVDFFAQY